MDTYSPLFGIVTALFEVIAAFWVLSGTGRKTVLRATAAQLFLLAGYQIMEVLICWHSADPHLPLARFAFLDVTWLPPLMLVLISAVADPSARATQVVKKLSYISLFLAAAMSFWIVLDYRFITGTVCQFMVAKYYYLEPYFHIYGVFYEVTQMSALFIPVILMVRTDELRVRQQLGDIFFGTLLFVVPALSVGAMFPEKFNMALPSLMCHFALFYALFLVRLVKRERA